MSFLKRITSFLILLCFAGALAVTAKAAPMTGSIRLRLVCGGETVTGGSLTLYRVGEAPEGAPAYTLCPAFAESGVDLAELSDPDTAAALAEYALAQKIEGRTQPVDEAGIVLFAPLELGVYLIVQAEPCDGCEPVRPFLVTIPLTVGDAVLYDIDASPKVALTPEPTEPTAPPSDPWLPQTGQLNWPVAFFALLGILLVLLGVMLRCIRKQEDSET